MDLPTRHRGIVARHSAALVVIDVQDRLAAAMPRRDETVASVRALAAGARELGVPVIVTRQYPKGIGEVVPELADVLLGAQVIDKTAFDCMAEPAFAQALRSVERECALLCGMEAHICVSQTAMSMAASGVRPIVVADAVCSRRDLDRDVALDRLRLWGIEVATLEQVLYEMLGRAGTDEFRRVLEIVKERDASM